MQCSSVQSSHLILDDDDIRMMMNNDDDIEMMMNNDDDIEMMTTDLEKA